MRPEDITIASYHVENRTILFGECDPAGILYTPRICEYIVEGALRFLSNRLGEPFERYTFARGLNLPARNLLVDFVQPLTWDDEIQIRAGLVEFRTHAYTVQVTAFRDSDTVAFSGRLTQVCVNKDTRALAEIPGELRNALTRN